MTGNLQRWLSSRWIIVAVDVLIVLTIYTSALVIRFGGHIPNYFASRFASALPLIAAAYVIVGFLARTYTSTTSLLRVGAVTLLTGISIIVVAMIWPGTPNPIPISVLGVGALGSLVGFTGARPWHGTPDTALLRAAASRARAHGYHSVGVLAGMERREHLRRAPDGLRGGSDAAGGGPRGMLRESKG